MTLCMVLAPHLATLTYASPHLIITQSVPGAIIGEGIRFRQPVVTPKPVTVVTKPLPGKQLIKTDDDDAWRVARGQADLRNAAEVSDATLCAPHLSRVRTRGG